MLHDAELTATSRHAPGPRVLIDNARQPPVSTDSNTKFSALGLADGIVRAIDETGYETPTPIQAGAIPPLLAGRDLLGQAQTGTGKTAAFALPLLSRLDLARREPQILVLTPTRELAIQVAEAMQTYARHLPGFHVLPIYGGQSMDTQLRPLRRGVHAIVGTPGRIADHLRRRTLKLNALSAVVLDEADEMLRMGFIDEVTGILEQTPANKQVALFSATMPTAIARIARSHLRDPVEVRIESRTATVASVMQRYWEVSGAHHKLDALTRILEVEDFDAMLVFVRTRNLTVELSERLEARGYESSAINGDMNQALRERTIERLKRGAIDILVATDVAARGLDVSRISHVINYDIPYDTEAYIHRIGRTGRAGRAGNAILFVAPRERRLLRAIEHATGQPIMHMRLPSSEEISDKRTQRFKQLITDTLAAQDLSYLSKVVADYAVEHNVAATDIAAALAWLLQQDKPLQPPLERSATGRDSGGKARKTPSPSASPQAESAPAARATRPQRTTKPPVARRPAIVEDAPVERAPADKRPPAAGKTRTEAPAADARTKIPPSPTVETSAAAPAETPAAPAETPAAVAETPVNPLVAALTRGATAASDEAGSDRSRRATRKAGLEPLVRYRVAVGSSHGAEARHIVGAIANESGLDSEYIGRVDIGETSSIVELPDGMPKAIFKHLKKVWVLGQQLCIEPETRPASTPRPQRPAAGETRADASTPRRIIRAAPGAARERTHRGDDKRGPGARSSRPADNGPAASTASQSPASAADAEPETLHRSPRGAGARGAGAKPGGGAGKPATRSVRVTKKSPADRTAGGKGKGAGGARSGTGKAGRGAADARGAGKPTTARKSSAAKPRKPPKPQ